VIRSWTLNWSALRRSMAVGCLRMKRGGVYFLDDVAVSALVCASQCIS